MCSTYTGFNQSVIYRRALIKKKEATFIDALREAFHSSSKGEGVIRGTYPEENVSTKGFICQGVNDRGRVMCRGDMISSSSEEKFIDPYRASA